jgi:hypothetical protein
VDEGETNPVARDLAGASLRLMLRRTLTGPVVVASGTGLNGTVELNADAEAGKVRLRLAADKTALITIKDESETLWGDIELTLSGDVVKTIAILEEIIRADSVLLDTVRGG